MNDLAVNRYAVRVERLRVLVRLGVLAVLTVIIAVEHPRPEAHGRGLVTLVTLALTVATEAGSVLFPHRQATLRTAVEVLACGVLAG